MGAPEVLFQPDLMSKSVEGIHKATFQSISKCDKKIQADLFSNIVLAGGSSVIPGMAERMTKELAQLAPDAKINIVVPDDVRYAAWKGGAVAITKAAFADTGKFE